MITRHRTATRSFPPRMQKKARHLIAVSTRCLISVANRFPAEVLQYYSYLPLAPGAPPGKAGAREGSKVPGLRQSGYSRTA